MPELRTSLAELIAEYDGFLGRSVPARVAP
jgi:hypothetical protein